MGRRKPKSYIVEKVLDVNLIDNVVKFRVKWQGYSKKENTWETLANFLGGRKNLALAKFLAGKGNLIKYKNALEKQKGGKQSDSGTSGKQKPLPAKKTAPPAPSPKALAPILHLEGKRYTRNSLNSVLDQLEKERKNEIEIPPPNNGAKADDGGEEPMLEKNGSEIKVSIASTLVPKHTRQKECPKSDPIFSGSSTSSRKSPNTNADNGTISVHAPSQGSQLAGNSDDKVPNVRNDQPKTRIKRRDDGKSRSCAQRSDDSSRRASNDDLKGRTSKELQVSSPMIHDGSSSHVMELMRTLYPECTTEWQMEINFSFGEAMTALEILTERTEIAKKRTPSSGLYTFLSRTRAYLTQTAFRLQDQKNQYSEVLEEKVWEHIELLLEKLVVVHTEVTEVLKSLEASGSFEVPEIDDEEPLSQEQVMALFEEVDGVESVERAVEQLQSLEAMRKEQSSRKKKVQTRCSASERIVADQNDHAAISSEVDSKRRKTLESFDHDDKHSRQEHQSQLTSRRDMARDSSDLLRPDDAEESRSFPPQLSATPFESPINVVPEVSKTQMDIPSRTSTDERARLDHQHENSYLMPIPAPANPVAEMVVPDDFLEQDEEEYYVIPSSFTTSPVYRHFSRSPSIPRSVIAEWRKEYGSPIDDQQRSVSPSPEPHQQSESSPSSLLLENDNSFWDAISSESSTNQPEFSLAMILPGLEQLALVPVVEQQAVPWNPPFVRTSILTDPIDERFLHERVQAELDSLKDARKTMKLRDIEEKRAAFGNKLMEFFKDMKTPQLEQLLRSVRDYNDLIELLMKLRHEDLLLYLENRCDFKVYRNQEERSFLELAALHDCPRVVNQMISRGGSHESLTISAGSDGIRDRISDRVMETLDNFADTMEDFVVTRYLKEEFWYDDKMEIIGPLRFYDPETDKKMIFELKNVQLRPLSEFSLVVYTIMKIPKGDCWGRLDIVEGWRSQIQEVSWNGRIVKKNEDFSKGSRFRVTPDEVNQLEITGNFEKEVFFACQVVAKTSDDDLSNTTDGIPLNIETETFEVIDSN